MQLIHNTDVTMVQNGNMTVGQNAKSQEMLKWQMSLDNLKLQK